MASIWDQARNTLKNLQAGATNVANSFNFNPNSNNGNNFWRTPVAQGLVGAQKFIESPQSINIPQVPKQFNPTINVGIQNTPFQLPIQPVQMARDFINTPASWTANTISDAIQNTGRTIGGRDLAQYQNLKSAPARLGYNIASAIPGLNTQGLNINNNVQNVVGNIAGTAEGPFSVYGGGKVFGLRNPATEQIAGGFLKTVGKGVLSGAKLGGTYGVLDALANGREKSITQDAQDAFINGAGGAVIGGIFGGTISSVGAVRKLISRPAEVEAQLRDLQGRYTTGDVPVKPKGMTQPQWDFQLNFNQKYKRNPYTMVTAQDLKNAVGYEVGKKGAGMSVRDVNKDINPLGKPDVAQVGGANSPENIKWFSDLQTDMKKLDRGNFLESLPKDKKGNFAVNPETEINKALTNFNKKYNTNITREDFISGNLPERNDLLLNHLDPQPRVAQPPLSDIKFYRGEGGSNQFQNKTSFISGKNFATDSERAKTFGNVTEHILNPKAKVLKIDAVGKSIDDLAKELKVTPDEFMSPRELNRKLQAQGYDAVIYKTRLGNNGKLDPNGKIVEDAIALNDKAFSPSTPPVGDTGLKLGSNLKLTDAYPKDFLGYNVPNLEKQAKAKGFNLYDALVKRVDSQDNMPAKLQGMESIMDDLYGKVASPVGVKETGAQIGTQEAPKLAPQDQTPQQVQQAQQSAQGLDISGNTPGGVQKPPSDVSVPDSSKYAYNINKDRLQMNDSQKQVLDTTVTTVKPELEKIKGATLSNDEIVKAAKTSDVLSQITSREQTMQAEAAILKARQRVVELNNNIDRLSKEGNTTEMQAQMKDLIESLKVVSSTAADTGRKLQSFNINAGDESIRTQVLKDITKTNANTDDILKAAQGVDWNNAESITKFYRKFIKASVMDVLDEYRYNNMLSNPKTHIRNAFSNLVQTFVTRPATLLVEGRPVEAGKYFTGAVKSLPEATDAFAKSFQGKTALAKPDLARIGSGKLPKFLTIPTRAMEAGDQFFTALIRGGEQARGATAEQAGKTAEYSLFRQGLNPKGQGPVLNSIDSLTNWTYKAPKAVRWFVPFIRTPMNFAKQWLEYSPAGFSTAIKAGNPREQIAKAVVGSTVTAFGGMLAMQGKTTWAAPTDPKQKDLFYASGRKPFSVLVGDKWVPMQYAGPFALALALPAAMKFYQEDNKTAPTDTQLEKATKIVSASAQFFSQQTFLSGLGNFVNWASGSQDVSLGSSLGFTAQQIVPMEALISYVNTIIDPVYRKAPGFVQSIQKNIPGLSQQLPAYTDPNGEPSTRIPSNYVAPYDLGQQNKNYEPALQIRGEKLQNNSIFNRDLKSYTALDGQIKDLVKAGELEKAKSLIVGNVDTLSKGEETKKFKTQYDEYYSDLDKVSASKLTPEQKKKIITIIKTRITALDKAYSNFQSQGK